MQEDLIIKAPGMTFTIGLADKPKPTPRVIHALGRFESMLSEYIISASLMALQATSSGDSPMDIDPFLLEPFNPNGIWNTTNDHVTPWEPLNYQMMFCQRPKPCHGLR